jgi:hypothetical protein
MGGASIEQARSALRLCLRHLAEGDRFNVIAFSDVFRSFDASLRPSPAGLVPFTQRTLEAADRWVAALDASGGTEMLAPLLAAVSGLDDPKRSRVIVLLTDGEVGNEADRRQISAGGRRAGVHVRHRHERERLAAARAGEADQGRGGIHPSRRAHRREGERSCARRRRASTGDH